MLMTAVGESRSGRIEIAAVYARVPAKPGARAPIRPGPVPALRGDAPVGALGPPQSVLAVKRQNRPVRQLTLRAPCRLTLRCRLTAGDVGV